MGKSGVAAHAFYSDTQEASLAYKVDSRQTTEESLVKEKKRKKRRKVGKKERRRGRGRRKENQVGK